MATTATKKPVEAPPPEDTMLYRKPGPHQLCQHKNMDYVIVGSDEVESFEAEGWHRSPDDAAAAFEAANKTPAPVVAPELDTMKRPELEVYGAAIGAAPKTGESNKDYIARIRATMADAAK